MGLFLTGCAGSRGGVGLNPEWAGPFAIPYADSVDAAWLADSTASAPRPVVRTKVKKRKPPPAAPSPAASAAGSAADTGGAPTPPGTEPTSPGPGKQPGPGTASPAEPKPPQLTVRLSAEETIRLDDRIQADLARTERALAALKDLRLTGEPADQVAAARRFLADARAARTARDFLRGAELAEKARVLAEAVKGTVLK